MSSKSEYKFIFCPHCGTQRQRVKSYCTRCGEWLADPKERVDTEFGGASPESKIRTMLWMNSLSAAAALFCAILLYATYFGVEGSRWSAFVAAGWCLAITAWQISNVIIAIKLRGQLRKNRVGNKAASYTTTAPALQASDAVPFVTTPQSVTDKTTELLEPVVVRQRKQAQKDL